MCTAAPRLIYRLELYLSTNFWPSQMHWCISWLKISSVRRYCFSSGDSFTPVTGASDWGHTSLQKREIVCLQLKASQQVVLLWYNFLLHACKSSCRTYEKSAKKPIWYNPALMQQPLYFTEHIKGNLHRYSKLWGRPTKNTHQGSFGSAFFPRPNMLRNAYLESQDLRSCYLIAQNGAMCA